MSTDETDSSEQQRWSKEIQATYDRGLALRGFLHKQEQAGLLQDHEMVEILDAFNLVLHRAGMMEVSDSALGASLARQAVHAMWEKVLTLRPEWRDALDHFAPSNGRNV